MGLRDQPKLARQTNQGIDRAVKRFTDYLWPFNPFTPAEDNSSEDWKSGRK